MELEFERSVREKERIRAEEEFTSLKESLMELHLELDSESFEMQVDESETSAQSSTLSSTSEFRDLMRFLLR